MSKQVSQKLKIAGWVAVGAVAGALTTVQLQATARSSLAPLPLEELQQLAAVFGMVKTDYVEPVDEKKLISEAISGMVSSLDPHSQYFDKKSFKEFREGTSGRFVGVGIEIGMEDGLVKVVSPIEDSPAFRAGLKSGDLITKIDDTPVKGMTINDAVKMMRGEPRTKVLLTIFRKDEDRTFPVTIVREEIKTQSVKARNVESGFGWIRVSQFQERTTEDVARKLEELYKADPNMKGLVLDLRNDPGGLLPAAVAISAMFLPEDVTVVSTNGQTADSKMVYKAVPQHYLTRGGPDHVARLAQATRNFYKKVPMVVLVNEGSASASEIVAGALQDHKRATIMGSQTFGKGSVQTVRPLGPDTGLKLTTARYYTPSGSTIQAKGIVPDVMVDETAEGNVFAALRTREADLQKHLVNGTEAKPAPMTDAQRAAEQQRDQDREAARKRLEEEAKKNPSQRLVPEFGSDKDFQLQQALNQLKGKPVLVSKTLQVRSTDDKEDQLTRAGLRLDDAQLLRYSRHILLNELGVEGQEKLLASHALIVGAGGLGSPAALYLGSAGVGRITVVDHDQVDETNLQRQIAHNLARVGSPKAESVREAIAAINPDPVVTPITQRADAALLDTLVAQADVVLDCTDNFETRHAINRACVKHGRPLVSGAAIRMDGQLSVYDTREAANPCYACVFPEDSGVEETRCATMGVFAPLVGIVGTLQAAEALKLLAGLGSRMAGQLLMIDGRDLAFTRIGLPANPACPVCGHRH